MDDLEASWDRMVETARGRDDRARDRESCWVPPILHALVVAARATTLRRFHPFTSHAILCFRDGLWQDGAAKVPCAVSLTAAGVYEVWDWRGGSTEVVRTTADPVRAAAELERLLADWR